MYLVHPCKTGLQASDLWSNGGVLCLSFYAPSRRVWLSRVPWLDSFQGIHHACGVPALLQEVLWRSEWTGKETVYASLQTAVIFCYMCSSFVKQIIIPVSRAGTQCSRRCACVFIQEVHQFVPLTLPNLLSQSGILFLTYSRHLHKPSLSEPINRWNP